MVSLAYVKMQGHEYVLCNAKGRIKASADKRLLLLYSRQRRENDEVLTVCDYQSRWPDKR